MADTYDAKTFTFRPKNVSDRLDLQLLFIRNADDVRSSKHAQYPAVRAGGRSELHHLPRGRYRRLGRRPAGAGEPLRKPAGEDRDGFRGHPAPVAQTSQRGRRHPAACNAHAGGAGHLARADRTGPHLRDRTEPADVDDGRPAAGGYARPPARQAHRHRPVLPHAGRGAPRARAGDRPLGHRRRRSAPAPSTSSCRRPRSRRS
jgi:hypothetical protein